MKFNYLYYGRLFDIFSNIKVIPWFKGQEKTASEANASILISVHQLLILLLFADIQKKIFYVEFYLGVEVGAIAAGGLYLFNVIAFSKWRIVTKRSKILDLLYVGAYIITLIAMIFYLAYPKILGI